MSSYKAVIFDLDGVIVSTDELHYEAWSAVARQEGIYFDRKINDRLRGVSRMDSLEILLERADKQYTGSQKQALAEQKNEIYRGLLSRLGSGDILPGVMSTLSALREGGLRLAIGSSSKNTPVILERLGLGDFFDAVSDGNGLTRSKPDPEVFVKAAGLLTLPPESCIVVEDAEAGIEAAKAASMTAAAVGQACSSPLADFRLSEITELIAIVCGEQ